MKEGKLPVVMSSDAELVFVYDEDKAATITVDDMLDKARYLLECHGITLRQLGVFPNLKIQIQFDLREG